MTAADLRRVALSLGGAQESGQYGRASTS